MSDICQKIEKKKKAVLQLKYAGTTDIIKIDDIIYAEVYHHNSIVVCKNNQKEYVISLAELEDQLKTYGFFRCHKSFLINMKHIIRYTFDNIILSNDYNVPISKYRRKEFLEQHTKFLGDNI